MPVEKNYKITKCALDGEVLIPASVLDKIRAEIADLADADAYGDYQQGFSFGLMMAVQIIDKYKAEVR